MKTENEILWDYIEELQAEKEEKLSGLLNGAYSQCDQYQNCLNRIQEIETVSKHFEVVTNRIRHNCDFAVRTDSRILRRAALRQQLEAMEN